MRGAVAILFVLGLAGCGARTTLDPGTPDAGPELPDAGRDAGQDAGRDAGQDAGRDGGADAGRDAGPAVSCTADRDCVQGVCRAQASFPPSDLAALPLACGDPDRGSAVGAPCRERAECDRGLCALAGACVMPCASDVDCDASDRCQTVYVRTGVAAMQPVSACVARVAVPDDVRVTGPEAGPEIPSFGQADDTLRALDPNALVVWTAPVELIPFVQEIRRRDAMSTVVFDAFTGDPASPAPAWGVAPTTIAELVTLLYPNGPETPASPEGFDVTLGTRHGARSRCLSRRRRSVDEPGRQRSAAAPHGPHADARHPRAGGDRAR